MIMIKIIEFSLLYIVKIGINHYVQSFFRT